MSTPSHDHVDINAVMYMVQQIVFTPGTGFIARVPVKLRFYVILFLAFGKLGYLRGPVALIQNCTMMARQLAARHGDTLHGRDLVALADLFERHPAEAAAFAAKWEADAIRQWGRA